MAFPRHYQTPEHDDYKIARFAQLGLMPTAMRSDPYFPAMNWNGASGVMEIDSSHRDRLSNSTQKKFRRWSRRLNGQHANGSGWVIRHEPSRGQAYPRACQDYHWPSPMFYTDERFPSEWRGQQRRAAGRGRGFTRRRARSQGPPSFPRSVEQEPLPYACDVAVSPSPRREWFLRSERRLFKACRPYYDDEPLATALPTQPGPAAHCAIKTARTRSSPLKEAQVRSPAKGADRQAQPRRSRLSERRESRGSDNRSCAGVNSEAEVEDKTSFYRRVACQLKTDKYDSGEGREETAIPEDTPVILKELRGRRIESPCKAAPNPAPVNVCLPLDANTFFGTKDKSRRLSADCQTSNIDNPRRPSTDLSASRGDKLGKLSIESDVPSPCINVLQEMNTFSTTTVTCTSNNTPKSVVANRRRSSQDSEISIIAVIKQSDKRKNTIEETPKSSASKSSKKSMDRGHFPRTPPSTDGPTWVNRRSSTESKMTELEARGKAPTRSSPTGDLRPKAIIKPGLRSAKKDSNKTPIAKTKRKSSSPTKDVKGGQTPRKLVQKTLDSFFTKGASAIRPTQQPAEHSTSSEGGKSERLRSAKALLAETEPTRGHVRRIYQDEAPKVKVPVVSLTPLEVERSVQSLPGRSGSAPSAACRLAHVTPIPSPAKKRLREDTSSPPRKMSRRSSVESSDSLNDLDTKKYDTVRDVSPSCPLRKVFSVSKVSDKTGAQDLRKEKQGSCSKWSKERGSGSPNTSKSAEPRDLNKSAGSSRKSSAARVPLKEGITSDETNISKENKRSSPRKLSKMRHKWKRSPSRKSILGPSDLSRIFKQAYLASKHEEDSTQDQGAVNQEPNRSDQTSSASTPDLVLSVNNIQASGPVKSPAKTEKLLGNNLESVLTPSSQNENICPNSNRSATKQLCLSQFSCKDVLQVKVRDVTSGRFVKSTALMDKSASVALVPASPCKEATSPACSPIRLRRSPTRASDCGSPARVPGSGSRTRTALAADVPFSTSPRTTRCSGASPRRDARPMPPMDSWDRPRSPFERVEPFPATDDLVVTHPEEELLQAQQDRAEQVAEAAKAAQRNKQRHMRGRKVYEYCPALDEHLERHPVQNEISADKWYKWLNPSQLRCLTLAMLDNHDLCLRYTTDAPRVEPWEAAWVNISRRLNTICYNSLTNLNTGLRLTVMEWKKLWLDLRSLIRTRVEAMQPSQRRHGLGSLECLLYSEKLYAALIKSNGECLGKECPRVWCSGACVGVFCPTMEATNQRKTEE